MIARSVEIRAAILELNVDIVFENLYAAGGASAGKQSERWRLFMKMQRWQDWVMLIFGIWLFVSPFWITGYAGANSIAAWNSYIFGVLVTAFAWAALATRQRWEEWIELVIGIWLVISPFVLLFYATEFGAAWNQIVLGVLIGIDALWALASYSQKRVEA